MNSRSITVLSLVGVLTAGSAAAMVNTRVLSKETSPARTESVLTVTGVPATSPTGASGQAEVQQSTAGSASGTATGEGTNRTAISQTTFPLQLRSLSVASATPVQPAAKSSSVTSGRRVSSFQVGDAGLIRLDSSTNDFRIAEVTPGSGWRVVSYTPGTVAGTAEVVLSSGSVEVTFIAELVGGNIVTRVESHSTAADGSGSGTSTSSSGDDDSDDDSDEVENEDENEDEDEDEDHDREDHEDEHEDEHEDDDDD